MKPPEMPIEVIDDAWVEHGLDECGAVEFAKAIIAARDKQWTEMLGEPVAWQWVDVDGLTKTIRMNPHIEHATPLYAPKQEKPE
jgi:hypothetical protein